MTTKNWVVFWLLGLIWGTSFLWIKIAVSEISPEVLVSFRTLFGSLGLAAVLIASGMVRFKVKENLHWLGTFALIGLINVALPFIFISWSEQYIELGIASILNSTVPLFTMIIAPIFLKDDPFTLPKFGGLTVGFVGVVLLFLPEISGGINQNSIGQGVMLLATFCYASGGVLARRKAESLPPNVQAFLQMAMASMMTWSFTLLFKQPVHYPQIPLTWLALVWLGLLGSCAAYMIYFSLLHSIGPTRTHMVTYITPLVGVVLGAIFLGERLHWESLVGGLLIITGIAAVNLKELPLRRKTAQE